MILEAIDDPHFTTELARYNLEINLDHFKLKDNCFQLLGNQLNTLLAKAREKAEAFNTKVVLTGILPTISHAELEFEYDTKRSLLGTK